MMNIGVRLLFGLALFGAGIVVIEGQGEGCWWTGCQPADWAVRGCSSDMKQTGQEDCKDPPSSIKFQCCPKSTDPVKPTDTPPDNEMAKCWWSGCQPSTWAVRGCPNDTTPNDQEDCDDDAVKYQCCPKIEPVNPPKPIDIPSAIDMASCWWSGCQPADWAVRGCPEKMVEIDSDSCGNDTNRGDKYRCCDPVTNQGGDEEENKGETCWFTTCKSNPLSTGGCPPIAVSTDIVDCDGGAGNQYQCCLKIPGAIDKDVEDRGIDYYKNYVRYLLLKANGFDIIPEHLKCTDVDPKKEFVFTIEGDEDGIRMCDLCPNFPVDKLANIVIDNTPFAAYSDSNFPDCFGDCYDREDCVASSFDHQTKWCYLYNTTLGKFEQEDGWTTVLINQPTGVVENWLYSRHTRITGKSIKSTQSDSFLGCLQNCQDTTSCTHVSYNFNSKQCLMFDGNNKNNSLDFDLEYGTVAGYQVEIAHGASDVEWRYTDDPLYSIDIDAGTPREKTDNKGNCPKSSENGVEIMYNNKCTTSGGLGCDSSTGCLTCYYPEIALTYRSDLSICPDSTVLSRGTVKTKLKSCFTECLSSQTCIGIDFNAQQISCDQLTLDKYLPEPSAAVQRYYLRYPRPNDVNKANLLQFSIVSNQELVATPNNKNNWMNTLPNTPNWNTCLKRCLDNPLCSKAGYSASKKTCVIASGSASIKDNRPDKNKDWHVFLLRPKLDSSLFPYKRTPGFFIDSNNFKSEESLPCGGSDCSQQITKCIDNCSKKYGQWCDEISMEYSSDKVACRYYSFEVNVTIAPKGNGEIYTVKFSNKTLNLDALNNLNTFQMQDLFTCFDNSDLQSQSTLVPNDDVFDFQTDDDSGRERRSLRVRRGLWDKIKNAFKKVGKAIVDTVKDVGKKVVDTVKNVGKTIGKVVTGDFKGAKDAFLNIPIVKTAKEGVENVIKIGKSVVKGDWKGAGNAALGLAGNALEFIPGPGQALKIGGKIIKNVITKGSKNIQKDVGRKTKDKVGDGVNKNRGANDKKNNNNKNDNRDKDQPDRCRRATNLGKRTRPGNNQNSCNNRRQKDKTCDLGVVKNMLNSGDCKHVKIGQTCSYECEVGFDEEPLQPKCSAAASGKPPKFIKNPQCDKEKCPGVPYPVLQIKVPNPETIAGRRTKISAYVLKVNKKRKLPIWSIALQDSFNSKKKGKQKRKDSFYQYNCLDNSQPKDINYPVQPEKGLKPIHKGHLTPADVMLFSEKAAYAANLYINTAPQDGFTNSVFWRLLEAQVKCFSNRIPALVATGICPNNRDKLSATLGGLPVPRCYWKMVCYRKPDAPNLGSTIVVGFISDNDKILKGQTTLIKKRKEQIAKPVSQADIESLVAGPGYGNPFIQGGPYLVVGRGVKAATLDPIACAGAKTLNQAEADMWKTNLSGKKKGGSRGKRAIPQNTRGCTAAEGRSLAALLGLSSVFFDEIEDNLPSDEDLEDDDDGPGGDGGNLVPAAKCNKRMIGYYPSWGKGKFTYKQAQRLTHVVYAFLEMKPDGTIAVGNPDPNNSLNSDEVTATAQAKLEQLMKVAKQFAHLKVQFAVGGWENSQYFSNVASSPQKRLTFIASIIQNIDEYDFDGVDLDWEYPVTGGAHEGVPDDKQNYVQLMKELREALDQHANDKGRKDRYIISFAGAAGQWTLDPGFDLPGLLKYADWVNVMTYDFFGAWASDWGAFTGPPAPLYFGMPKRYSGKTNVDWTMKYYACRSKSPHQINMGVPFYGRYWKNVGAPVDPKDGMWRNAVRVGGVFEGGYAGWKEILQKYIPNGAFQKIYNEKVEAPYMWNEGEKTYLGYEDKRSLKVKADYASKKNLGGLMIWAIDQDDPDLSMLETVYGANLCANTDKNAINFKCSPITEKRWWTSEDGDDKAGLCGRSAPLYKGFYPVCDPDDPGYACCGSFGYCGTGDDYCKCPTCVNFAENPEKILENPTKPSVPVQWYFLNAPDGKRGRCGPDAPPLNGKSPICNPDDKNAHCCSNGYYCGSGKSFCDCKECVDFTKDPHHEFKKKP